MTKVIIVLDKSGAFCSAYCNDEIEIKLLQEGVDDKEIASTEVIMEEIEVNE